MKALFLIVAACAALALTAGPAYLKLSDGRVLRNPYLLDQTPSSVTIGHDDGAVAVPLKELTPELQKELGYDPKAAAAHEAQLQQARRNAAAAAAKTQAEDRAIDSAAKSIDNEQRLNARIQELEKQLRDAKVQNQPGAPADTKAAAAKPEKKPQQPTPEVDKESFSSLYGNELGSQTLRRYKTCRQL